MCKGSVWNAVYELNDRISTSLYMKGKAEDYGIVVSWDD